jgi:hypothetical protein
MGKWGNGGMGEWYGMDAWMHDCMDYLKVPLTPPSNELIDN